MEASAPDVTTLILVVIRVGGRPLRVGSGPPGNAGFTARQKFLQYVYKGKVYVRNGS